MTAERAAAWRRGQADFLRGLVESGEGVSEGLRFLVSSGRWSRSDHFTVADAIHAEEEYRAAVEAALGEVSGLVVVDMPDEAEEGIKLLREEGKGKARLSAWAPSRAWKPGPPWSGFPACAAGRPTSRDSSPASGRSSRSCSTGS